MDRKKELKALYKETPRPTGIYQIRNTANGKLLIGSSLNLDGSVNSNRFQLKMNCHRNSQLQQDWQTYGETSFIFEVLEELKPADIQSPDCKEKLNKLEEQWLDKLQPYGDKGYNKIPAK